MDTRMDDRATKGTPQTAQEFQRMANNALRVEGRRAKLAALRELDRVWPHMPETARREFNAMRDGAW